MAISSIANFASSVTRLPSASCPTCGSSGSGSKTSSSNVAKNSTLRSFSGGYTGRGDSFACATCGSQKSTTASKTTASSSSAYCPTCAGNNQARSPFSGNASNTYNCPTCSKGLATTGKTGTVLPNNTTAWAR